jgi:hypothetical protein
MVDDGHDHACPQPKTPERLLAVAERLIYDFDVRHLGFPSRRLPRSGRPA